MSEMSKETYIALQMACELRQIITDKTKGFPSLGLPNNCFPLPPMDGESFEQALRRIFGDYVYTKVMNERRVAEGLPDKYKDFTPKGPEGVSDELLVWTPEAERE